MLVSRNESKPNRKLVTLSADGATGWSWPAFHEALWEPRCMAGLITHPSGALMFSNPHTLPIDKTGKEVPNGRGKRENLSIKLSYDDGKTWTINKTLEPGKAAYSDLAVLRDGTVLCLFERADSIDCARFNLQWLQQP
jgi:sialidase-1